MNLKLLRAGGIAAAVVVLILAIIAALNPNDREKAPELNYRLIDGRVQSANDLHGKVMLVNFWATTCSTCVKEIPKLVETYQKFHPKGLETLAVAMKHDNLTYIGHFVQSRQLPFWVSYDDKGELAQQWGQVQLTPTTFLVNKRGEIVKRYVGEPDFAQLDALIARLLQES